MANPIMKLEENRAEQERVLNPNDIMTINGSIEKIGILGLILVMAAAFVWSRYTLGYTDLANMLTFGGLLVGFILALIISFARTIYLIPVYAIAEGLFIGGISAIFENSYPGIVIQATTGTLAALFSMLILYRMGIISCTDKFKSVIFISTGSIAVIYLANFIGSFFGYAIPAINTASNLGILFSIAVVIIASLNLIIDFDFIESGVERMYPKQYEWFGAFGLMVTLVWLYIEILKLVAKLRSRD